MFGWWRDHTLQKLRDHEKRIRTLEQDQEEMERARTEIESQLTVLGAAVELKKKGINPNGLT